MTTFIQLVILFAVIIDPLASMSVFYAATRKMPESERRKNVLLAILLAAGLSFSVALFGNGLLGLFSTDINEFRVAGGIVLLILGIKMALGMELFKGSTDRGRAIAAIIGTPMLTGPAAITAIIISVNDSGFAYTIAAVGIVLFVSAVLLYLSESLFKRLGDSFIQAMSTILGLITISWGVRFIIEGVKALF